ncbi:hypothetical protein E3N88_00967 [Mikania micrantha]|uniref:Uncharacterized protein n=1 Tax=Mikania micrantha TaxID=192012 RepID=A0A5N6Q1J2_9ASTR|nr:hypothetical protein E3N88_00967 [Mikania micrantha]
MKLNLFCSTLVTPRADRVGPDSPPDERFPGRDIVPCWDPTVPSRTKSSSETAAQVAMEEPIQEQPSISMEPVSPSGTMADEDLFSTPELSVDATKESSKLVGQLEEAVNAKVNFEAAAASEGPVILDDSSTEELFADEPTGGAIGSISSGVKTIDKGKRKLTQRRKLLRRRVKGYDVDEILLWLVPRMAAELDRVQQQEQAAAAAKLWWFLQRNKKRPPTGTE